MRERTRTILGIALPIIGGMVSQNVLNLVDTAMVGRLGPAALAAVGTGGFANFMAMALVTGLSSGVQSMAARRMGQGRDGETAVPLNGALLFAVAFAIPFSALLYFVIPTAFPYLNSEPEVIADAVPYMQARVLAMTAVGMNYAFRGYWNGVNLSRLYLQTLVVMHTSNIVLNWILIFGKLGAPALGAEGAGIASAISTYVGTGTYIFLGLRHARAGGFLRGLPDRATMRTILRLAVPSGVQALFFSSGYTAMFWILGQVGTEAAAAASVVINVMLVAILPGIALGMAAASLVGQALGRKDPADAKRWGWDVVRVASTGMAVLGLPMVAFPELILSGFLDDPHTLKLATLPLQIFGATIAVDGVGMVLLNALLGAGASRMTMVVSIVFQWGLFLPAAYIIGPVLGYGLLEIWVAQVIYRGSQGLVFAAIWQRGRWANIDV